MTPEQLRQLLMRLDNPQEAIEAQWEVVVLSALSAIGDVQYESPHGGTARPDIAFRNDEGLSFVADIRTLFDEEPIRRTFEAKLAQQNRALKARGVAGTLNANLGYRWECSHCRRRIRRGCCNAAARSLTVWCQCPKSADADWRRRARYAPDLPQEHRLNSMVFGSGFRRYLEAICRAPEQRHQYTVDIDDAYVCFWFGPGDWLSGILHTNPLHSLDLSSNKVDNALGKKNRQISRSGWTGPRGVFLCDGGFELFHSSPASPGLPGIVRQFLFENKSLDFVCSLSIKDRSCISVKRDLGFSAWMQTRYEHPQEIALEEFSQELELNFVKPGRMHAENSRSADDRHEAETPVTNVVLEISADQALDCLLGKVGPAPTAAHLEAFDEGRMIVAAEVSSPKSLRPTPWVKFSFGRPDPAAAARAACMGIGNTSKSSPPERYLARGAEIKCGSITLSGNAFLSLLLGRIKHSEFARIVGTNSLDLFATRADGYRLADIQLNPMGRGDDDTLTFQLDTDDP